MVLSGIYLSFATETYYRISRLWKKRIVFRYGCELMYWISQTMLLYAVLYRVNYGQLRLYIFLACFCGVSIYIVLFQRSYKRVLEWLIETGQKIAKKLLRFFYVLLFNPLYRLVRFLLQIVRFIFVYSYRFILSLINILFFPLRRLLRFAKIKFVKKLEKGTQTRSICSTIKDKLIKWFK